MPNKRTAQRYQNQTNIVQVIKNKVERAKATYIINPDGSYMVNYLGNILTPAAFDTLLPIEVHTVSNKGEQCSSIQRLVA